jgi:molybdopterin/thiamine biosynthesis adenylyltransferase
MNWAVGLGVEQFEDLIAKYVGTKYAVTFIVYIGTIEFSSDISRNHFPHFKIL